jgi:hypothetical protein
VGPGFEGVEKVEQPARLPGPVALAAAEALQDAGVLQLAECRVDDGLGPSAGRDRGGQREDGVRRQDVDEVPRDAVRSRVGPGAQLLAPALLQALTASR